MAYFHINFFIPTQKNTVVHPKGHQNTVAVPLPRQGAGTATAVQSNVKTAKNRLFCSFNYKNPKKLCSSKYKSYLSLILHFLAFFGDLSLTFFLLNR
jgi:hypothetical protein